MYDQAFEYARNNLAKVQIFMKDPYISLYLTEEKFTEMAFAGSIGGVLGLFLGFSFISSVEIVFLFCVRPFPRNIFKRIRLRMTKMTKEMEETKKMEDTKSASFLLRQSHFKLEPLKDESSLAPVAD